MWKNVCLNHSWQYGTLMKNTEKHGWKDSLFTGWHASPHCLFCMFLHFMESFWVCIIGAQCLLQTTRTSRWFLSDLEEKYEFSGKLWPITKCLGSTIVFIVFKFLVLGQASRYVSKNTHYGSGMPQISSIKVPISTLNLVYSFIKWEQSQ